MEEEKRRISYYGKEIKELREKGLTHKEIGEELGFKREQIKKRDKYLWQVCLKDNVYNYDDLQVHHIIPIDKNYDLKLDENNLITLCSYHHKQAEQNKITKECLYKIIDIPLGSND